VAKKKLIEHNALLQAIEMGTDKEEVMQRFGYKSASTLKVAYLDALMALDKVPAVNNKRQKKKTENIVKISNRGNLVIPKNIVDLLGLSESDHFKIEKTSFGLSLKLIEKPPKTILRKNTGSRN
jgi:hypothetical protein